MEQLKMLPERMRGIQKKKKDAILKDLVPKMPMDRRLFWQSIPSSQNSIDLLEDGY